MESAAHPCRARVGAVDTQIPNRRACELTGVTTTVAGQLPAGLYQEQGRPHTPNSLDTGGASGGAELGGGVLLRALAFMPFAALPLVQSYPGAQASSEQLCA